MKKSQSKFRIKIFYVMLLGPLALWLVLSCFGVTESTDSTNREKRNKHEIAEGTDIGTITSELELYYNDRVPFRSILLDMDSNLKAAIEMPYMGAIRPGLVAMANAAMPEGTEVNMVAPNNNKANKAVGVADKEAAVADKNNEAKKTGTNEDMGSSNVGKSNASSAPATDAANIPSNATATNEPYYETPVEAGYFPYSTIGEEVIQGRDDWLFTVDSMPDYGGTNLRDEDSLATLTSWLQEFEQNLNARGAQLYTFFIPNKSTVYPEYMPSIEAGEYHSLQQLEDYIKSNSALHFEFLTDEMLSGKREGQLYSKHDTHWNSLGALVALNAIHHYIGMENINIASLDGETLPNDACDLIDVSGMPASYFGEDSYVQKDYKTDINIQFLREDNDTIDEYIATSTNPSASNSDERTLVLIGDSYRHHMKQYIFKDFAHTYIVNWRSVDESSEIVDIINNADVVILQFVERNNYVGGPFGSTLQWLNGMLGQ